MSGLDTLLEEDQRRRLAEQQGAASAGQMDQMAGSGLLEDDPGPPPDAPPAPSGDETAPPPAPEAETAPQGSQTPAQDLLKQVQGGQISRPALDKAFGPPPTPQNEPGAQVFAPKMGGAPGIDWKGLSDRLAAARQRDSASKQSDNWLTNIASVLNPRAHVDSGSNETAGAEDELRLAQAKQKMSDEQAQAEGRGAKATTDAAELARRRDLDSWKEMADRMKLTEASQKDADAAKSKDAALHDKAAEEQAARSERESTGEMQRKKMQAEIDLLTKRTNAPPKAAKPSKTAATGDEMEKIEEGKPETLPADIHQTVVDLSRGIGKMPDAGSRNGQRTLEALKRFKPGADPTDYEAYQKVRLEQSTDKGLLAIKVAREHLAEARSVLPDNFDSRLLNRVKKAYAEGTGGTDFTAPEAALLVAAHEVANVYGVGDATGKELIEKLLDPTQSPAQLKQRLATVDALIAGKERGYQQQREAVAPGGAKSRGPAKEGDESKLSSGVPIVYRGGKWVKK